MLGVTPSLHLSISGNSLSLYLRMLVVVLCSTVVQMLCTSVHVVAHVVHDASMYIHVVA